MMKDFPMFTTEYGVASLILKEVPYRQEAYIILQASETPDKLLEECVSFCRMVGAEKIYARGHEWVERYPLDCTIYEMRGEIHVLPEKVRCLWPVTPENVDQWRSLLNEKLRNVDNAGTLDRAMEKEILASAGAYFVHDSGNLLGAGWIQGDELKLIAASEPGRGEDVLQTLLSTIPDAVVKLQVASTNFKAIRFYERMGFVKTAQLRSWFRVI